MESEANWLLSYDLRLCCDPLTRIHSRGQKDLGCICYASQTFNARKWMGAQLACHLLMPVFPSDCSYIVLLSV